MVAEKQLGVVISGTTHFRYNIGTVWLVLPVPESTVIARLFLLVAFLKSRNEMQLFRNSQSSALLSRVRVIWVCSLHRCCYGINSLPSDSCWNSVHHMNMHGASCCPAFRDSSPFSPPMAWGSLNLHDFPCPLIADHWSKCSQVETDVICMLSMSATWCTPGGQ